MWDRAPKGVQEPEPPLEVLGDFGDLGGQSPQTDAEDLMYSEGWLNRFYKHQL